jgi:DNA-binding response OmpR family regulator
MMANPDRILVVEDDRSIAVLYGIHLVAAGYAVRIADDGLAALHDLAAHPPSLVVLDLQLPLVSGFRLLQVIKRASSRIPVLVTTSLLFEEAEEVARTGADAFLTKPIDPEVLLQKVTHHLTHRRHSAGLALPDLGGKERRDVPRDVDRFPFPRPDQLGQKRDSGTVESREQLLTLARSLPGVRRRAERVLQTVGD